MHYWHYIALAPLINASKNMCLTTIIHVKEKSGHLETTYRIKIGLGLKPVKENDPSFCSSHKSITPRD